MFCMATSDTYPQARRRPQWSGEPWAVLVRLPAAPVKQLRALAGVSERSLSDIAAPLIPAGMTGDRA